MGNYFSTNLKFIREQRGLSQNKLAEIVGVNQTTIARWEDDNRTPNLDNAIDVSKAFDIPLPVLIGTDLKNNSSFEPTEEDLKKVLKEKGLLDNEGNLDIEKIDMANKIYDAITKKED